MRSRKSSGSRLASSVRFFLRLAGFLGAAAARRAVAEERDLRAGDLRAAAFLAGARWAMVLDPGKEISEEETRAARDGAREPWKVGRRPGAATCPRPSTGSPRPGPGARSRPPRRARARLPAARGIPWSSLRR